MRQGPGGRRGRGGRHHGAGGDRNGSGEGRPNREGGNGRDNGNGNGGRPRSASALRHQTFDSNGPDVRVRGNAWQVHEKYQALARDAASSGDRIAAESYLQHAEHYFRIIEAINEATAAEQRVRGTPPQQPDYYNQQQPSLPEGQVELRGNAAAYAAAATAQPGGFATPTTHDMSAAPQPEAQPIPPRPLTSSFFAPEETTDDDHSGGAEPLVANR